MKDYEIGRIRHWCSNEMRKGKFIKVYRYTPKRKRCPNCDKNITIQILNRKPIRQKVLVK